MKITLVTDFTPTIDNYGGPSALCFYLFKELVKKHEIQIISQNVNKVPINLIKKAEQSLGTQYVINSRTFWQKCIISSKIGFLFPFIDGNKKPWNSRFKLRQNSLRKIEQFAPDVVWVYPHYLFNVMKQLQKYPVFALGPDCSTLGCLRTFEDGYVYRNGLVGVTQKNLKKQISLEQEVVKWAKKVAVVGLEDKRVFNNVTKTDKAVFLPHPHYSYLNKQISFSKDKLKILFTGALDHYTETDFSVMAREFETNESMLQNFKFTFIGKGWLSAVQSLMSKLDIDVKEWVDNYSDELVKHDVQVVPISMGVGTKGKVLDAISNGLLCVGSYYAFENIAIEDNSHCLIYQSPKEIVSMLLSIEANRECYEQITKKNREDILLKHDASVGARVLESISQGDISCVEDGYLTC